MRYAASWPVQQLASSYAWEASVSSYHAYLLLYDRLEYCS